MINKSLKRFMKPLINQTILPAEPKALLFQNSSYGEFQNKVLDIAGDIDISFQTGPSISGVGDRCVLSQCSTNVFENKEFRLYINNSLKIQAQVGGNYTPTSNLPAVEPNTIYRILLQGSKLQVFINSSLFLDVVFNRGVAIEPTAKSRLGIETHGAGFRANYNGLLSWIVIQGYYYPLDDYVSMTQGSWPSSNNNLILFNPVWVQISNNFK